METLRLKIKPGDMMESTKESKDLFHVLCIALAEENEGREKTEVQLNTLWKGLLKFQGQCKFPSGGFLKDPFGTWMGKI